MTPEDLDVLWQQVELEQATVLAAEIEAAWAERERMKASCQSDNLDVPEAEQRVVKT